MNQQMSNQADRNLGNNNNRQGLPQVYGVSHEGAMMDILSEAFNRMSKRYRRNYRLHLRNMKRQQMIWNPRRVEPPTLYQRISAFISEFLWDKPPMPKNLYSLENVQKERKQRGKQLKKGFSIRTKIPDPPKKTKKQKKL